VFEMGTGVSTALEATNLLGRSSLTSLFGLMITW
jgi:hypothetical protein